MMTKEPSDLTKKLRGQGEAAKEFVQRQRRIRKPIYFALWPDLKRLSVEDPNAFEGEAQRRWKSFYARIPRETRFPKKPPLHYEDFHNLALEVGLKDFVDLTEEYVRARLAPAVAFYCCDKGEYELLPDPQASPEEAVPKPDGITAAEKPAENPAAARASEQPNASMLQEDRRKSGEVARSPSQRVILFGPGESAEIDQERTLRLTAGQYDVVLALLEAGQAGLTKDSLDRQSGHGDSRGILRRLAKRGSLWESVISFPGKPGVGYRIL